MTTSNETPKDTEKVEDAAKAEAEAEMKLILADIDKLSTEELIARTNELGFEARTHKANARSVRSRIDEKTSLLRANNDKIARGKQLPYLVGHVVEILDAEEEEEDLGSAMIKTTSGVRPKAAVVKTTMRTTHYLPEIGLVDADRLHPGDIIALNQDTKLILEELPTDYDVRAKAMELDERPTEKYSDIGGLDKQILEMVEAIVLPMTHAEKFKNIGIKPPKGVLLYGPPGTGKTLLARACAAQTKATFLKLSATSLIQTYIGEGAKIVRDAFQLAKDKGPSIVFIDEIDAVGGKRNSSEKSGDREVQRTLLELLNQLDGFTSADNVKVIAATNRVDILDPALLRSGRIDRKIELPNPNEESRARILQIHSRKMNVGSTVNFEELSRSTNDFNGAQLKAVCVEAGMIALRRDATELTHEDFMEGIAEVQAKKKKSLSYYA